MTAGKRWLAQRCAMTSIALMQRLRGGARVWSGRCDTRAAALGVAGARRSVIARAEATVDEVAASDVSGLAMLSMALRAIRTLVAPVREADGRARI